MMERVRDLVEGREHYLAGLIVLVALAMRLKYAFISGMWVDEGRYALVATALLEHPLQFMSPYHGVITNIPPVFPYLVFVSQAILGYGKTAVYLVSPVMGALGVGAIYLLGRELFGTTEGLVAAALLATSPVYFFLSERILIGVTLTFLYITAVFLFHRGLGDGKYARYAMWASGPVTALALLTKQPAYLLGPILGIYLLSREGLAFLKEPREYRDLYIAAGLGLLVLAPWLLRNFGVCGRPFCSSSKAINHILASNPPDWANTGGPFYYFTILPSLLSILVAAVFYIRYTVGEAYLSLASREARKAGIGVGAMVVGSLVAFFVKATFIPLILLAGITYLQDTDEDRLLWLWITFGVGFMSLVAIKVPRYVVFVVPALLLLVARTLNVSREKLTSSTRFNPMTGFALLAVVVVALSGLSYSNATTRVKGMAPGFQQLEPAGKWFRGKNVSVLSTSPRQEMFYSRNSADFEIVAANNTKMVRQLRSGKYDYFVIDAYERTRIDQVKYVQRNLMNTSLLRPVKAFRQNGRPVVLVFRVNAPA